MTIIKGQGHILKNIGLYLTTPLFSHPMLYVGLSRVRTATALHIHTSDTPTNRVRELGYITYG